MYSYETENYLAVNILDFSKLNKVEDSKVNFNKSPEHCVRHAGVTVTVLPGIADGQIMLSQGGSRVFPTEELIMDRLLISALKCGLRPISLAFKQSPLLKSLFMHFTKNL